MNPPELGFTAAYTPIEDGWYMAQVMEFPEAMMHGVKLEEAREMIRDAVQLILEARREMAGEKFKGRGDVVLEPLVLEEAGR